MKVDTVFGTAARSLAPFAKQAKFAQRAAELSALTAALEATNLIIATKCYTGERSRRDSEFAIPRLEIIIRKIMALSEMDRSTYLPAPDYVFSYEFGGASDVYTSSRSKGLTLFVFAAKSAPTRNGQWRTANRVPNSSARSTRTGSRTCSGTR